MKIYKIKVICILLMWIQIGVLTAQEKTFQHNDSVKMEIRVYGESVPKAISTASISSISGSEIKSINTPNLGNMLAGKLTGLNVSQTGSAPGYQDWPWMLIRGKGSFLDGDGNDIKIVVDGFETKWYNIIPDEIESISVLKDAPALALYGMDGANGVLYIKTKRGTANNAKKIALNARFSLQQPSIMPKYVGNGDYARLYNVAMASDGKDVSSSMFGNPYVPDYYQNGDYPYVFADIDWLGNVTKPSTYSHDYTLSVNGGNKAAQYNVILGFMNTQGLYNGTDSKRNINSNWDLKRYTVRTNIDVEVTKYIRSEISLRATIEDKLRPNTDESALWKNMGVFLPYNIRTESGAWGGSQNYPENPVVSILGKGYRSDNDRTVDANVKFIGDLGLLTKGLETFAQVVFSNNYYSSYNKTRDYSYTENIPNLGPFGLIDYEAVVRGSTSDNFSITQPSGVQWNRYNLLAGLSYTNIFNDLHRIHSTAMYTQELYRTTGSNMPWAKMGVVGRTNYSYANKYIAELGYSLMASAEYAPGKRLGVFPAISAAWVLSEEDFLKDNNWIDYLKLRTSYGIIGSDLIGSGSRFTYRQYYIGSGNPYYLGSGYSTTIWTRKQGSVANPNVTWEKSHKFNIGLEGTLRNSVDFSVEYFNDNRTDIFVSPASYMSALIGADYYNQNAGVVTNQGVEAELKFRNKIGEFNYAIGGRFTYAKNKIVDMKESPKPEDYLYMTGNSVDQPLVLEYIGFFKDENDIATSPAQMFGSVKPGDVKYKDQNGDKVIDDNDRKPFGNPVYPRFFYGADLAMEYKGFDLSVFVQGVGGRTISLLSSGFMTPFVNGGVKPNPHLSENYWTPDRGENALYPRLTTESNSNNYRASTLWQRDGSYLRIKNIELGYTFPAHLIPGISAIRLYLNTVNSLTFSKVSELNIDPETNSPFKYPFMKSTNVGLSLQF